MVGSLGRAKRILEDRVWECILNRYFLSLEILMETWSLCDLCGIGVIKLRDHMGPGRPKIRSS